MARPFKETVEYFSHYCNSGKTLFIIQSRYGNDGYAFWYKLLELLGVSEGHSYDFSSTEAWGFLLSKTCVDDATTRDILNSLAELNAIDKELLEKNIIWSQNFVDGLDHLYRRRKMQTPERPGGTIHAPLDAPAPQADDILDPVLASMVAIYESNIGQATPILFERIKEIRDEYPDGWFAKSVEESVTHGKRNLKYIEAILANWKANGIGNGKKKVGDQGRDYTK